MNFSQVTAEYRQLKVLFNAGQLSEADFKTRLNELMLRDEQGNWWIIGYETGQWHYHDGTQWVRADPPSTVLPTIEPTPTVVSPAVITPPPSRTTVPPPHRKTPWLWIGTGMALVIALAMIIPQLIPSPSETPSTPISPTVMTQPWTPVPGPTPTETMKPPIPTATLAPTQTPRPTVTPIPSPTPTRLKIVYHNKISGNWDIWIMNADGTDQRPLLQSSLDELVHSWSPTTGRLVYTLGKRWSGGVGDSEAYSMNADGTDIRPVTQGMSDVAAVSWHPDDSDIIMASNRRGNDSPETICGKYRGPKQENTKGEAPLYDIVALENGRAKLLVRTGSTVAGQLICGTTTAEWSPDGRQFIFAAWSLAGTMSRWNIYRMNAGGSNSCALTTGGGWHNEDPTWSPDGRLIAYISNRLSKDPNNYGIFVIPATCNAAVTPITFMLDSTVDYRAPAWSPDGRKLAFRAMYTSGYTDIFVADVDPQGNRVGEPQQLTHAPTSESGPVWVY